MTATVIDGKASAARLREKIAAEAVRLKAAHGLVPGLATVLVGNDPASEVYVRNKNKTAEAIGFKSVHHHLPETASAASRTSSASPLKRLCRPCSRLYGSAASCTAVASEICRYVALITIVRKETDRELKRSIVERLAGMPKNKAAQDYLMEIIK